MKILLLLNLAALLFLCKVAVAEQNKGFFAGGNAAYISSDAYVSDPDGEKVDTISAELVAGYKYNDWLGIDLRYGLGVNDRQEPGANTGETIEYAVDSYQSIYYRPEIINKEAKLYFLIGYTTLDTAAETFDSDNAPVSKVDYSESGTSYGLGAGWFVGDELVINVEYRQLLDKDEDEFSVITFGADYRF
ncbi:MAG: porin family protein [Agarilytica sp.]